MRKAVTLLLGIAAFSTLLACDLAYLPSATPVVIVVTATPHDAPAPGSTASGQLAATPVKQTMTPARPTATRRAAAATQTPRPTLPPGPTPNPGMGNATGRILWNGKGVANLDVKLCESILLIGGCSGKQYPSRTDATGRYLFTDIPPRKYSLAIHALEKESWLYVASFAMATTLTVTADDTLDLGDQSIYKYDLKGAQPTDESKVSGGMPRLSWDEYPGAAYYKVTLSTEHGRSIFYSKQVDDNEITPETPLVNCKYSWRVDVHNADDIKIAQFDGYSHFAVIDQSVSCYVILIAPTDKSKMTGSAVGLTWETHSAADYYKVYMSKTEAGKTTTVLNFLQVREPSYRFSETLGPGKYNWSVSAYDQSGGEIAKSSLISFTIE